MLVPFGLNMAYHRGVRHALVVITSLGACSFGPAVALDAGNGHPPDGGTAIDGTAIDDATDATTSAGIALVQQTTASAPNTNAPLSATLSASPINGDLLVMVGAAEHGGLATVSGGGVTSWTRATRSLDNTNIEIWYGVCDGSSATVTITFPAYTLPIWMAVSEWSGMASTNVLDSTRSISGNTSPAGAGTLATTNAHDVLIFAVTDDTPNTFGAPTQGPWSAMTGVSPPPLVQAAWYREVSTAGSYGPTVTETAHSWESAAAAFRAAP